MIPLQRQGYHSVEDVTTLAWEDLEDIGIVKLGHQKKVLLAIRRVQDLRAGKRIQPPQVSQILNKYSNPFYFCLFYFNNLGQ